MKTRAIKIIWISSQSHYRPKGRIYAFPCMLLWSLPDNGQNGRNV